MPLDSSNTDPYISSPPYEALPPENTPPYCVYPPTIPTPAGGYTPTTPAVTPIPPTPDATTTPNPPSIVPNPPTYVPSPVFSPPSYYEPSPPSYYEPSPPGPPQIIIPSPPSRFLPPIVYPPPAVPPPPRRTPVTAMWCVAKAAVPDPIIQEAMNYACFSGAECEQIQPSGSCFQPNTLFAHASYAFNSYWQRTKTAGGSCDFGGVAILVTVDPSYDGCHFVYF
ncbi:hypothetical protein ACS0TY_032254 [Phlomoides rotata]